MRIVIDFAQGADEEAVIEIARKIGRLAEGDWLMYGAQQPIVESDVVGSVMNLKSLSGSRVSAVDVISDQEAVIYTSGGAWRLRAEIDTDGNHGQIAGLLCSRKTLR